MTGPIYSIEHFTEEFSNTDYPNRVVLLAQGLLRCRDGFRDLIPLAASRSVDARAFRKGLELAIELDPSNLPGLRLASWDAIRVGEYQRAKIFLTSLIRERPHIPDTRREYLRCAILDTDEKIDVRQLLNLASPELHTDLASSSYAAQLSFARDQSLSSLSIDELHTLLDQSAGKLFRTAGDRESGIVGGNPEVFLEILQRISIAKSIALVGNGPALRHSGRGSQIDEHDLVIRINFPALTNFEADVGRRTDVVFFNEALTGSVGDLIAREPRYASCLSLAFHPEPSFELPKLVTINAASVKISRATRYLREFYRSFFYTRPTTGLMGLILICTLLRKHCEIYGFDFYSTKDAHYFLSTSPVFLGHELDYERWFVQKFLPCIQVGEVHEAKV